MLNVSGFIIIPKDNKLREYNGDRGSYLTFQAAGEGVDKNGKSQFHMYQINLWIPNNELEKWKKLIVPTRSFYLKTGDLVAPINGDKIGYTQIKTTSYNLKPMVQKLWFEKET